jgi:signal peptidase I
MQDMDNFDNTNCQEECPKEINSQKSNKKTISTVLEYAEIFTVAISVVIILFSFFFRVCTVSGPSMEKTLYQDEKLIISNLFYTPERNDIVVFHQTGDKGYNEPIVKRVIATEGETIDIDFATWTVTVTDKDGNTTVLDEDYLYLDSHYIKVDTSHQYPYTVPEGHVFVMGDNRNNSLDSRSSIIGPVDTRRILGKVILRITPISKFGAVD